MNICTQETINRVPTVRETVTKELLAGSFLSCLCGFSNNFDGAESVLIRDKTAYRGELDMEEDDSDIEDPFQDLPNEDADGIAHFTDPED